MKRVFLIMVLLFIVVAAFTQETSADEIIIDQENIFSMEKIEAIKDISGQKTILIIFASLLSHKGYTIRADYNTDEEKKTITDIALKLAYEHTNNSLEDMESEILKYADKIDTKYDTINGNVFKIDYYLWNK